MATAFDDPRTLSHHDLEEGKVFAPQFADRGLVTVVTIEAATGDVLMVAHMNAEALALTLETGEVHYFSRSRNKLWKKGETSGEVQQVVDIRTDCDQDAVVVRVKLTGRGASCHTGRKSCFYRRVEFKNGRASLVDTGEPRLFDPEIVYNR
jgi:phosphoribosyl-AMP cyclohydrolase